MVSPLLRAMMVAFYVVMAWKFFTLAAITGAGAVLLTARLDPAGAVLIPIAGFLAWVGSTAYRSMRTLLW